MSHSHPSMAMHSIAPAYTMPDNATNISVLRIVVREGLSADLARSLHDDCITSLATLD